MPGAVASGVEGSGGIGSRAESFEGAHAEPALRALHPFTSRWVPRFSTTTRACLTAVRPCLFPNADGTFGVGSSLFDQDLARYATAREALTLAARHLLPDPGPAKLSE